MSINFGFDFINDDAYGQTWTNMANMRFHQVCERFGIVLDDPWCGSLDPQTVLRAAMRAANKSQAPIEGIDEGGPGTGHCRIIQPGIDEDYFHYRAQEWMRIARAAIAAGQRLTYG